jgi:hypothetical protein
MTAIPAIPSLAGVGQTELVSPTGGTGAVGGSSGFANLLSQKLGGVVDLQNEADSA